MSKNWKKLKALRKALSTDYQGNILDYLLDEEKGHKQYNYIVYKFVLDYLKSLNIRRELGIFKDILFGRKCRTNISLPQELYDKFISFFPVRIKHLQIL